MRRANHENEHIEVQKVFEVFFFLSLFLCSSYPVKVLISYLKLYTLSEAWSGVDWADLMAAQGAFGTDFYDRSILRPKHRAYYRSGRPVIKIGPKGALGRHEIRPIHSTPSRRQSIVDINIGFVKFNFRSDQCFFMQYLVSELAEVISVWFW